MNDLDFMARHRRARRYFLAILFLTSLVVGMALRELCIQNEQPALPQWKSPSVNADAAIPAYLRDGKCK